MILTCNFKIERNFIAKNITSQPEFESETSLPTGQASYLI